MIKFYVDPIYTKIYGMDDDVVEVVDALLSFRPGGYFFTTAYQNHTWDGNVRLLTQYPTLMTFTGLLKRIIDYLKKNNIEYRIIKSYNHDNVEINDNTLDGIVLRDYQKEVVDICKLKKRGIIQSATGSGKTEMFIKLAADINVPSVIVVNRTSLLGQLKEKLMKRLNFKESEINVIGMGVHNYKKNNYITIGTFQSLMNAKFDNVISEAKMIIFDEAHHVSSNRLGEIAKKAINAIYKFGFSATPFREDGYDMMIEAYIGPKIKIVTISDLIAKGYLAKPIIYFIDIPNKMNRKYSYVTLYKELVSNQYRNEVIAKCAYEFSKRGKIVLISILRLEHIQHILKEIEKIDDIGLNIKVITGKDPTHEKIQTIKKMNTGEYNIVISTLFGEGVDVPNLDVLINARAVKSAIDAYQQAGRVLRLKEDKSQPIIIDFNDYNTTKRLEGESGDYFQKYAKKKMKIYKYEAEFDVRQVKTVEEIFGEK